MHREELTCWQYRLAPQLSSSRLTGAKNPSKCKLVKARPEVVGGVANLQTRGRRKTTMHGSDALGPTKRSSRPGKRSGYVMFAHNRGMVFEGAKARVILRSDTRGKGSPRKRTCAVNNKISSKITSSSLP